MGGKYKRISNDDEELTELRHWSAIAAHYPKWVRPKRTEQCTWCDFQRAPYGKTEKLLNDILDGKTQLIMDLDRPRRDIEDEQEAEARLRATTESDRDNGGDEEVRVREVNEETLPHQG